MKWLKIVLVISIGFFLTSCTEEELGLDSSTNYVPLNENSTWEYNNELSQGSTVLSGNETLNLEIKNQNIYQFSQIETEGFTGISTSLLAGGEVFKRNQSLILNANLDLDIGLDRIILPVTDFVLYNVRSSNNQILSTSTGVIEENINGFTAEFNYEILSIHKGFQEEKTVNGITFENILISELQLNLSAQVFIIFSNFTIIPRQNVMRITHYFAENVGLVFSEVHSELIFDDTPSQFSIQLEDVEFSSTQALSSFNITSNL